MPDTTRTFVAVAIPESVEPRLVRLQSLLSADVPEARWTVTPPYHVTLAFLGDVPHADLAAVCRASAAAASPFPAFELTLEGVGAFPDPARPRVFWAGVAGPGLGTLLALQAAVADALRGLGYPPDRQPFRPHVTIGRTNTGGGFRGKSRNTGPAPRDLAPLLHRRRRWGAGPFLVTEAVTFGSAATEEGPAYARLGRAPLAGRSGG